MPARSRTIGYCGSALELTVYPLTAEAQVTAYMWGGAGGGGGGDGSRSGGNGTGGGFAIATMGAVTGDVLRLFIGGGGGGGAGATRGGGAGTAGSSYIGREVFGTRNLVGQFGLVARTLSYAWSSFMNANAVWLPYDAGSVDVTTTISVPSTGNYELQGQCDNAAVFYIDGNTVLTTDGYGGAPNTAVVALTSGNHTLRIIGTNYGGPAGVAFTITSGDSFSGAPGGNAGPAGSSGAGGGGGGATLILLNDLIAGVAGGGGGGAGAGNTGANGQDAPGSTGQTTTGYNGQSGQNQPGDGGGGGGGGGGWDGADGGGGNGGLAGSGDVSGFAGGNGLSYSNAGAGGNPNGRIPGGNTDSNYVSGTALGGFGGYKGSRGANGQAGGNGYAVIYLTVPGVFVHDASGGWVATEEVYVKVNGVWETVNAIYIKRNGEWIEASGDGTTNFLSIPGFFGVVARPAPQSPSPPASGGSDSGGWNYNDTPGFSGGGVAGSKIVCTAMNEQYGFGSFRNRIWLHYASKNLTKAHEVGYHTLFMPLVNYGYKQGDGFLNCVVRNVLENIARHRSADLRAEMRGTKRDTIGRAYRLVLEPLCWAVGKIKGY